MKTEKFVFYRMARKIFLTVALLATFTGITVCKQTKLNSFQELLTALKSGKNVKVIIHYSKCRLLIDGKDEKAPEAIGGMELKTFEYFAVGSLKNEKAFISFSENVLIYHTHFGYVYNYIKLRVYDDDTIEIIARYLDPKTFEMKMDEKFYTAINNTNNEGAGYFYTY